MSVLWKEPFDVHNLKIHWDERGFLIELLRFIDFAIPAGGQLYTFSINAGKRRGDHFHLIKREWFTCVYGKAIILLGSKDGQQISCEISHKIPKLVYAGPGTAHALINQTDSISIIVSYGSTQHKVDDPDTYSEKAYPSYESDFNKESE